MTFSADEGVTQKRSALALLFGGAGLIVLWELLLCVAVRGWLRGTAVAVAGHFVRVHMTPLAWTTYLAVLCGLLGWLVPTFRPSRWRYRLVLCWLWSVPAWCYFDWLNFYFMRNSATGLHAWEYQGLPANPVDRFIGYLLAFGAIAPAMFLTAEIWLRLGLNKIQTAGVSIGPKARTLGVAGGVVFFLAPFFLRSPSANLLIWMSLIFLLDPINFRLGRPSIVGDLRSGRWGRMLALMAGGLTCGFLWEFWNYWAIAKWTYHLPFLGVWQHWRYFQMPVLGLAGFPAFGVEVWVMWQFSLVLLHPIVEGECRRDDGGEHRDFLECI